MVMALEVLEWSNWHIDRLVGDVVHRFTLWVAEEARIEQVNEIIIHIPGRCHALCFVQQSILPGAVGICGSQNFLRQVQFFRTLNDAAVFTRSQATRGSKAGHSQRCIICFVGDPGVLNPCRTIIEVGNLIVAKAIHVVLVEPMKVRRLDVFVGKLLIEIERWTEGTVPIDHGTFNTCRIVDQVVGKAGIDMLIDNIKNDSDASLMAGIDQALQSLYSPPALVGSEIVERPIPPVEIQLQTRDRHQLQTGDAKAFEVRQAFGDTIEGAIELLDMELIDHQVFQCGSFPLLVGPDKVWNKARSNECREPADIRCPRKGISKPGYNHLRGESARKGLEKLVTVQVGSSLPEVGSWCDGDGDVGLPETVRRISYRSKRKVHRFDIWNEAVVLVDDAYQNFVACLWFNARKIYSKPDIYPRAGRCRNKGSNFVNTDHLSCLLYFEC